MKLLYIFYAKAQSGNWKKASFTQVVSMCNAFCEIPGAEVFLAIPDHLTESFQGDYKFNVKQYSPFLRNQKLNRFMNYFAVKKLIRRVQPEYVLSRDPVLLLPAAGSQAGIIFESHNYLLHNGSKLINLVLRTILKRMVKLNNFRLFITISEALAEFWISRGIDKDLILALHDGFSVKMFRELPDPEKARVYLEFPINKKIIMYVGSLYADREIENILNLARDFPMALFVIVGGPDNVADSIRTDLEARHASNVILTGSIPHEKVPVYLASADILLALWSRQVKTINYCSPLKLFEYMASGKVIIAHSFPTIREVLVHEKTGLLVDPDSYQDLKQQVSGALNENHAATGENARREAFEKYSWDQRVARIMERI